MRRPLARALFAAAFAAAGAAGLAGACNPAAYDDYALGPGGPGGVGGSAGRAAACNGFYSDDTACQTCFQDSYCCTQANACDEDCKGYIACASQCRGPEGPACEASCKARYAFGPGEVEGLLGCLADACSQCDGLSSESGPIGAPPGGGGGAGGPPSQRCQADNACIDAACKDCDEGGSGSCETDTFVSKANCGACGRNCLATACDKGQCLSASVTSGVRVSTRLAAGGGYLYWVSTPDQIDGLPGDTLYRVDVANGGAPEQAYVPPPGLEVFDLAADAAGFYLVTNQGVKTRAHASAQQPAALAAEQNGPLAESTAPGVARIAANEGAVFFTTPLPEGQGTQAWSVPKAGGAAQPLATLGNSQISMLVADGGGVFVGASAQGTDAGVWYMASGGGGKVAVYGAQAGEFAVSGDDLLVVDLSGFDDKLVALTRDGPSSDLLPKTYISTMRALAADASGLYYLAYDASRSGVSLMRVRREPGAPSLGAPTTLLDGVPEAELRLPLALDAAWVYGASSGGTGLFRVPK